MTQRPNRRLRHASRTAAAALAAAALVLLAGCSSSDGDGGDDTGTVGATVSLIIGTGSGIRGVEASLTHDPSFVVTDADPAGAFNGETCESNVGVNFLNLLCVRSEPSTFDAPATGWRLRLELPAGADPNDLLLSIDCLASDLEGNTFPVACYLD